MGDTMSRDLSPVGTRFDVTGYEYPDYDSRHDPNRKMVRTYEVVGYSESEGHGMCERIELVEVRDKVSTISGGG